MLNEILSEFEKVREKDKTTKKSVKDLIRGLKNDLKVLESNLEDAQTSMTV